METLIRLILCASCLMAVRLGVQMAKKTAGRGKVTDVRGLTIVRTTLVVLIAISFVWWFALPESVPAMFRADLDQTARLYGTLLFILGWSLRVWSQVTLQSNWSADISAKVDGRVIQNGPYALTQHPIYLSYVFIAPAMFAMTANWFVGATALSYTLVSIARIPSEERFLVNYFGFQYLEYATTINCRWKVMATVLILAVNIYGAVLEMWVVSY